MGLPRSSYFEKTSTRPPLATLENCLAILSAVRTVKLSQDEIRRGFSERGLQCAGEDRGAFHFNGRSFFVIENVEARTRRACQVEVAADDDLQSSCTEWLENRDCGHARSRSTGRLRRSRFGSSDDR